MGVKAKAKVQPKGRLMNQKDIEAEFGIPRRDVIRWAAAGKFPAVVRTVDRTFLFRRAEVERWAEGYRPGSAPASNFPCAVGSRPGTDASNASSS